MLYLVPLATKGFVPTDPIRNPVRWALEDENGKLYFASRTFETPEQARAFAVLYGYVVAP